MASSNTYFQTADFSEQPSGFDQSSVNRFAGQRFENIAELPSWLTGLGSGYRQLDKQLGGWLPGGGTASPATRAVQRIVRAASTNRPATPTSSQQTQGSRQQSQSRGLSTQPSASVSRQIETPAIRNGQTENRPTSNNILDKIGIFYGQLDKNLAGGMLPGGAASLLSGTPVPEVLKANAVFQGLGRALPHLGINAVFHPRTPTMSGHQAEAALDYLNSRSNKPTYFIPNQDKYTAFFSSDFPLSLDIKDLSGPREKIITTNFELVDPAGRRPSLYSYLEPQGGWNPSQRGFPHSFDRYEPNIRYPSSIFLHEAGHALNSEDPFWSKVQQNRYNPKYKGIAGTSGLIGAVSSDRENPPPLWQAGLQGAAANLLAPENLPTLSEEAAASIRARNMSRELNLPFSHRQLAGAWSSYAAKPLARGFSESVISELGMRGVDWLSNKAQDFVTDRRPPTKLEQQLSQYGFDKDEYRLRPRRTSLGANSNELVIEQR